MLELVAAKHRKALSKAKRFECFLAARDSARTARVHVSAAVLNSPMRFSDAVLDSTGELLTPVPGVRATDRAEFWRSLVLKPALAAGRKGQSVHPTEMAATEGTESKGVDAPGGASSGACSARKGDCSGKCGCKAKDSAANGAADNGPPATAGTTGTAAKMSRQNEAGTPAQKPDDRREI